MQVIDLWSCINFANVPQDAQMPLQIIRIQKCELPSLKKSGVYLTEQLMAAQ